MYLDVYERDTHQDTIRIHARYITIHQDTYPIGKNIKNDRNPTAPGQDCWCVCPPVAVSAPACVLRVVRWPSQQSRVSFFSHRADR